MRNTYEPHQQKTTTEHQIHDLGQVPTNASFLPFLKHFPQKMMHNGEAYVITLPVNGNVCSK